MQFWWSRSRAIHFLFLSQAIEDEFEVEISDAQSDAIATAQDAIDFLDSQKLTREVKMDAKAIKEDKREIKV